MTGMIQVSVLSPEGTCWEVEKAEGGRTREHGQRKGGREGRLLGGAAYLTERIEGRLFSHNQKATFRSV